MEIVSEYDLRDKILQELNSTYAESHQGKTWNQCYWRNNKSYGLEVNLILTGDILALIAYTAINNDAMRVNYYGETLENQIRTRIWAVWHGGTTAENCAKRICEIIGA